jgi:anti-sigma B factor antagonist
MASKTTGGLVSDEHVVDGGRVLVLSGEIDVETSPGFRERVADLYQEGVRDLVIDLRDVTFTDSSGIGSFVVAHKLFAAGGGHLALSGVRDSTKRVLDVTGLDRVLDIRD